MLIQKNQVVTMNYRLEDKLGMLIDSCNDGSFMFIQGSGQIIPGLERAIEGKKMGDKLQVTVASADGYGERDESLVETVDRARLKTLGDLEIGLQFEGLTAEGEPQIYTIKDMTATQVTLDANHPLAGFDLNFSVHIVGIREATKEELEHGHVHGDGCHH